jgi:putative hydroxymethylpyrimidine transport system permease protein
MKLRHIVVSMLVFLALWQSIIVVTGVQSFILPPPAKVLTALWRYRQSISEHGLVTLTEVVIGMGLGCVLGIATAVYLTISPMARVILRPILVASQAIPVFALAPLLTLWFGFGIGSKIIMTVMITYFPVASAYFDGLSKTPAGYLDLAQTMGAPKWRVLMAVRMPAALPSLATGLRLAAVYAPIGAIIGEWVGASKGLGALMILANGRVKTDLLFAALIVLALLTGLLYFVTDRVARRLERDH